jgi:GTP pyrophosphokinase
LEDLAFRYLEPGSLQGNCRANWRLRRAERARKVETAVAKLQNRIKEMGFQATVTGRPKHIYSIYRKMRRKRLDL